MEEFLRPYTDEEFDKLFKESGYPEIARQYCKEILAEWMNALIDGEVKRSKGFRNPQDVLEDWRNGSHEKPTVREETWTKVDSYVQVYLSEREYGQSHEWSRKYTQELLEKDSKVPYENTYFGLKELNETTANVGLEILFHQSSKEKGSSFETFLRKINDRSSDIPLDDIINNVESLYSVYQQQIKEGSSEPYAEAFAFATILHPSYNNCNDDGCYTYDKLFEYAIVHGSDDKEAHNLAEFFLNADLNGYKLDEFSEKFPEGWQRELYYQKYIEYLNELGHLASIRNKIRNDLSLPPIAD